MEELKTNVRLLHNLTYKKILFRLINIYESECACNEGNLCFNDLLVIYGLLSILDEEEQC